ncbi:MAG TPA: hypothetical protein VFN67_28475 [Polyangiales bacterium]|nr:hypothetical protein [Polyangiales bacterium]
MAAPAVPAIMPAAAVPPVAIDPALPFVPAVAIIAALDLAPPAPELDAAAGFGIVAPPTGVEARPAVTEALPLVFTEPALPSCEAPERV